MTPALSGTALVMHNLGLAAGFGGSLFGKVALNPAVKVISSEEERGKVANVAWNGFNWINAASFGTAALTWFVGRTRLSGREMGRDARRLVLIKDILLASTVIIGGANMIAGSMLNRIDGGYVPLAAGDKASDRTPPEAVRLTKFMNVAGIVNLITAAGVIAVTSWLNMKAGASHRWSLVSRFLP